jgi:uncharacterized protein with GYD domain
MPTYVTLMNWTDEGVKSVRETMERAAAFRADLESRSGKLLSIYWTRGRFDIVATFETPDAETGMAVLLALEELGNVRTETLVAFSEVEMASIVRKM